MRRWLSLTRKEQRLVISAAAHVGTAAIGVRVFGLRRLLKWADRPITANHADANAVRDAKNPDRVTIAVERAGRYVPGGTCLARSLALTRMLRTRGVPAETYGAQPAGAAARTGASASRTPGAPAAGRMVPESRATRISHGL